MGNSPTFLSMKQMREVIPLWQNMSVAIFKDKEANEVRMRYPARQAACVCSFATCGTSCAIAAATAEHERGHFQG
jgi:hypothetical protein